MQLACNNVRDRPQWARLMAPVNLQIHKDAWALLHMILRDQATKVANARKVSNRLNTLRAFSQLLFVQSSRDDKNAFDLFDALRSVQWDRPCEVNAEFLVYHAAWRGNHPYSPADTPPVSFESMSRIRQLHPQFEG